MDFFKDYYKMLKITPNAKEDEIKAAYKKLAKEFHPDLYADNPLVTLANDKLKELNEAYEVLSNKEKRKQYDEFRKRIQNGFRNGEDTSSSYQQENVSTKYYSDKYSNNETNYKPNSQNCTYSGTQQNETNNYTHNSTRQNRYGSYNYTYGYKQHSKTNNINQYACYLHKERPGVKVCIICGTSLCEECAGIFDKPFCVNCLIKNNDAYMSSLRMSIIMSIVNLIIGGIVGLLLGVKYNFLGQNGILEGIIFGTYLTNVWLYLRYIGPTVKKYMFKLLSMIFRFFAIDEHNVIIFTIILNTIISLSIGWVFGLIIGTIRLVNDYKVYVKYKPEYLQTKEYIKKYFNIQ